jgi:hypothetical protein
VLTEYRPATSLKLPEPWSAMISRNVFMLDAP